MKIISFKSLLFFWGIMSCGVLFSVNDVDSSKLEPKIDNDEFRSHLKSGPLTQEKLELSFVFKRLFDEGKITWNRYVEWYNSQL